MINKYGKFKNKIEKAKIVFDSIPMDQIDEVIIGGMMKAFINNNCNYDAIDLYFGYQELILTNDIAHMLAIKACTNAGDFQQGRLIHENIKNLISEDKYTMQLNNTLIDFYGAFGDIDAAQKIFDSISDHKKDIVSMGTMMKCYMNNNHHTDALVLYESYPDLINDVCHMLAIKACTNLRNYRKGREIHDFLRNEGIKQSIQFQNTLIDFYGSFGLLMKQ